MIGAPVSSFLSELEDLTENERAWVGFLRLITQDSDPAPTLALVQALRRVISAYQSSREAPG